MSFPRSHRIAQHTALVVLACSLIGLSACRSDRVSVNAKDPNSPQYAYRLDELALLQMAADDIHEMERRKQYGQIYDEYGSDGFKKNVSRRRFLIMSNCVETHLGGIEEFNPNELGFRRKFVGGENSKNFLDVLNRKVIRIQGSIEEQLVFVPNGLNFRLNGLYWIAKDKQFLQCIANSPHLEAETAPKPEGEGSQTTAGQAKPTESGEQATQTPPASESAEQSGSKPQENVTPEATPQAAPSNAPPTPVQGMNASEIKKQPLEARPAGAGAVIDERPVSKKRKSQDSGNTTTPESGKPAPTPSNTQEPPPSDQPPIPQQEDD